MLKLSSREYSYIKIYIDTENIDCHGESIELFFSSHKCKTFLDLKFHGIYFADFFNKLFRKEEVLSVLHL